MKGLQSIKIFLQNSMERIGMHGKQQNRSTVNPERAWKPLIHISNGAFFCLPLRVNYA